MRTDQGDVDRRFDEIVWHLKSHGVAADGEWVSASPPARSADAATVRLVRLGAVVGGLATLLVGVLIATSGALGSLDGTWQVALGLGWLVAVVPAGALTGSLLLPRLRRDRDVATR